MSSRREELTRTAARLFADRGYHGTSLADLAEALGIQKASLYHHIDSKEDLLWEGGRGVGGPAGGPRSVRGGPRRRPGGAAGEGKAPPRFPRPPARGGGAPG